MAAAIAALSWELVARYRWLYVVAGVWLLFVCILGLLFAALDLHPVVGVSLVLTLGGPLIFVLGGTNVALEETLEDSLCAELVVKEHHGVAFGAMATVNGIGDFFSSIVVGALWSGVGTTIAFGYSMVLSLAGAILVIMVRPPHVRSDRI